MGEAKTGSAVWYNQVARSAYGNAGTFYISEKISESLDPRFDAILNLGVMMNHHTGSMDNINSLLWTGKSKQARRIDKLFLLKGFVGIDEPSSEDAAYTQVKVAMTTSDHGKDDMAELSSEGTLIAGWMRNFYDAALVSAFELIAAKGNDATQTRLIGSVEAFPRTVAWQWQTPNVYDYGNCPMHCTKPLAFYHWTDGNVAAHVQWAVITAIFGVRFFRRKRWWRL